MHMPDGRYIACSQYDYITAASNDIPERWMRAVERS
jgi:formiminoglutamase